VAISVRAALAGQRIAWRVPQWWAALAALAAWLVLIGLTYWPAASIAHLGHIHAASASIPERPGPFVSVDCVIAMMLPVVLFNLRQVAIASLWGRRDRAMLGFLVGYSGIWITTSLLLGAGIDAVAALLDPAATIALTVIAAFAWHLSPIKRRALRACHQMVPLAPRGWQADRDCVGLGLRVGSNCVVNCWVLMSVVFTTGHHPVIMGGAMVVMVIERFGPHAFADAARALKRELAFALTAPSPAVAPLL